MRTTYIAKEADIVKKWYVIDAEGVTLGRLASEVASILRGKNKPQYAPNADMGDYVIIVNAAGILIILKHEQRHTTGRIFSLTISEVSFEGGTKVTDTKGAGGSGQRAGRRHD